MSSDTSLDLTIDAKIEAKQPVVKLYALAGYDIIACAHKLINKGYTARQRLQVIADDPDIVELNKRLWSMPVHSFLPHAIVGSDVDSEQPVLLANYNNYLREADPPFTSQFWLIRDSQQPLPPHPFTPAMYIIYANLPEPEHAPTLASWQSVATISMTTLSKEGWGAWQPYQA